jgi:Ca-activated chloride channel family protein
MNLAHPHFAEPQWLWLAVLAPLALVLLQRYSGWRRHQQLAQIVSPEFVADLTRSSSPARRAIKNVLVVLATAGLGVALARPQWGQQTETSHLLGQDLVFVLDCSRSMLASDALPNRLQRAKLAILDFVHRQGQGRVGLVAFAGQAFLQCPLTFDYNAFQDALMAVDERTIPVLGTDVGRALDEAYRSMDKAAPQKLLVLVTDGEDLEQGGVRAAEAVAKQGVVVYTIGVGTPAGAEIQFLTEQGRPETQREKGEPVRSRLDEPTLRAIAQATHGAYYPLGPLGEGLARVRLDLENRSASSGSAPARKFGVDRFHVPVAGVLGLLVIESLIGTRRRQTRIAPMIPPPQPPPRGTALAGLVLAVCLGLAHASRAATAAPAPEPPPPSTPREFFNAGTAKLQDGKLRDAEAAFESALASQRERVQPVALYNLGHVRFGQGAAELKKGPAAAPTAARGKTAAQSAQAAIRAADEALAGEDVQKMVAAYLDGRGVRRELKAATKAVKRAMQTHGVALAKWQRSAGDFKSTVELQRTDTDARQNAETVDRCIAKLIDTLHELEQTAMGLGDKDRDLGEKLKALKGRIPAPDMPPGAAGDDEEEEEMPNGQKEDQKEGPTKEGEEMALSPEQASWLLEGFKLDADRRLPMGQQDTADPKAKNRKPW